MFSQKKIKIFIVVTIMMSVLILIPSVIAALTMPWHTFMGGSSNDSGNGIALDGNGNVYVVGSSYTSWGAPVNGYVGGKDAFVTQLDSTGARQWNTFLGSTSDDEGNGIAVDGSGDVYVIGTSRATWGSPLRTFAGGEDAFVAKLNSSGGLQWLTFLGGSAADNGNGIALDKNGNNVYVVGTAGGVWGAPVNPYPGGWYAPFVAKLDSSTGALQWNTFWGAGGLEAGQGIAVDGSDNVYVIGDCNDTWGSPVNAYVGGFEACVAKLNSNGNRVWNTFLGSVDSDGGYGITVDESSNVYVTGYSHATWGAPLHPHGGPNNDVFVARLNGSNGVRQWNTFMGFADISYGRGIAVDRIGNVYVVGDSKDTGTVFSAVFLAKFDIDGFREWNIFEDLVADNHDNGRGVVEDGSGHLYIAGDSIQGYLNADAFAARLDLPLQTNLAITKSANPDRTVPGGVVTYRLTFANRNYLTATDVLITDAVPTALTNFSYSRSGAVITPTGSISYTWQVQDLAPGEGGVITITGIVSPGLPRGTSFINTATIAGTKVDSNPDNNSSSAGVMFPFDVFLPVVLKD